MGGVLKYVSKLPDSRHFAADLRGGISQTRYGGTNSEASGSLNLPIAEDRVALRVGGFYTHDAGYIDSPTLGLRYVTRPRIYCARASMLYPPTDRPSPRLSTQ